MNFENEHHFRHQDLVNLFSADGEEYESSSSQALSDSVITDDHSESKPPNMTYGTPEDYADSRAAVLEVVDWYPRVLLTRVFSEMRRAGFETVAQREAALAALESARIPAPYARDRRFPERGHYVCAELGVWSSLLARLRTSLQSRARARGNGPNNSEDHNDIGSEASFRATQDVQRSMSATIDECIRSITNGAGLVDRVFFEAQAEVQWGNGHQLHE